MNLEHKKYILENQGKKSIKEIASDLRVKERAVRRLLEKEALSAEEVHKNVGGGRSRFDNFIPILLIILLGFIVYSNSLGGKFILDDDYLVKGNKYITNIRYLPRIFAREIENEGSKSNFYRPVQILAYMIDYALCKYDVRGYHLTSTLLHIITALAIYWLASILFNNKFLSLSASLLFIAHPVHTEAIAYISGAAEPLAAIFVLLAFIFYIKENDTENIVQYFIMLSCCILALLSKEASIILPALLLLYRGIFKKKLNKRAFFSVLVIACVYIMLRVTVFKAILPHAASNVMQSLGERLPGFFAAIANYMRILILPFDLHMEYGKSLFKFSDLKVWLGALLLFSFLFYAAKEKGRNKVVAFSILWFFITLMPVSNLYPVNAYMAEHWLYLPSFGFFLILGYLLSRIYNVNKIKYISILLTLLLLLFYSYLTIKQNSYWKEPMVFYERTLRYSPDSSLMNNNLGNAYYAAGKKEKAITLYKKAIAIDNDIQAYGNLACIYNEMGRKDEAVNLYKEAISLDKTHGSYGANYDNLGLIYKDMGEMDKAIESFKKVVDLNIDYVRAYEDLGAAYATTGKVAEAEVLFKKAIRIEPGDPGAYYNLSILYHSQGKYQLALQYVQKAIELGCKVDAQYLQELREEAGYANGK